MTRDRRWDGHDKRECSDQMFVMRGPRSPSDTHEHTITTSSYMHRMYAEHYTSFMPQTLCTTFILDILSNAMPSFWLSDSDSKPQSVLSTFFSHMIPSYATSLNHAIYNACDSLAALQDVLNNALWPFAPTSKCTIHGSIIKYDCTEFCNKTIQGSERKPIT